MTLSYRAARGRHSSSLRWGTTLVLVVVALRARAETSAADQAAAQALFDQGNALVKAGDWSTGCEKLEQSMRLDPAVSTQVKIARCRIHEGKLATGFAELEQALLLNQQSSAGPERKRELEQVIRADLDAILPRLPSLTIRVEPQLDELRVIQDGRPLPLSALGTSIPVDPGPHRIEVKAPGYRPETLEALAVEGQSLELPVVLSRLTPTGPLVPLARPRETRSVPSAATAPTQEESPSSPKTLGYVLGGTGLTALAVAGYFAYRTLSLVSDSRENCSSDNLCNREGMEQLDRAGRAQNAGFAFAGAGALALGLGAYFVAGGTW